MSIPGRFVDLVRANLRSWVSKSVDWQRAARASVEDFLEEELEAELQRRRARRQSAGGQRGDPRRHRAYRGSRGFADRHLAQLYAQLECSYGADLTTVRKQYRELMRRYHPDMHGDDPDKQRLATELSQRLTAAYNELRQILAQ